MGFTETDAKTFALQLGWEADDATQLIKPKKSELSLSARLSA